MTRIARILGILSTLLIVFTLLLAFSTAAQMTGKLVIDYTDTAIGHTLYSYGGSWTIVPQARRRNRASSGEFMAPKLRSERSASLRARVAHLFQSTPSVDSRQVYLIGGSDCLIFRCFLY